MVLGFWVINFSASRSAILFKRASHKMLMFFLFQEAFKAVQDVHHLIKLSKKPPKPHMLANFYEKMALVFRKAGSKLFHAATLHRQFVLFREQKKAITQEELTK